MQAENIVQQRASIYQWFSQLLFQELTEEQLVGLASPQHRAWIASLDSVPGLSRDVKRFEHSLNQALQRDYRQQELAADFASLFLLAPPQGISPYAGHYPHASAPQERRQMNGLLVEYGLAPRDNETSDHVAVQLALMARMVEKDEPVSVQYGFLHHHLLRWLSLFRDGCLQRDTLGFYAEAVSIIVGFMCEDERYLQSLLMEDFYRSSQS